jgi:hypothetical protein
MKRSLLIFVVCLVVLCIVGVLVVRAQTFESYGALVYDDSNQSCNSGTLCVIAFPHELMDTSSFHDNITYNDRLTVPYDGFYLISAHVNLFGSAVGSYRQIGIRRVLDGVNIAINQTYRSTGGGANLSISTVWWLSSGQSVQLWVGHDAGVALTISALADYSPQFRIVYQGWQHATPQPTFNATSILTLIPTDTPGWYIYTPTPTILTLIPTDTPGWYIYTPTPTSFPAWVITSTLSSGTVVMYDRSETLGDWITAGVLLAATALVIFGAVQREARH